MKVSENNGNSVFVEMLRGRDGGMEPQEMMGDEDLLARLDLLDPLVPRVGGLSTPGGGRGPVLK